MAAIALLGGAAPVAAATRFDPALRFRMLPTEHFVIYFHQGEAQLAARLAVIAEETWESLRVPLGATPPRRTHVVLADQTDSANGWATPLPYNTIVIFAASPPGFDLIGRTDDWLRLVFVHEFTHIVHLDRSAGWARVVRGIFGRVPLAFPNLFLPAWQIEGLATYQESAATGAGRLHASNFRAIEREAARERALEPLDRVNGGLTDWPGGHAAYAYGLGFHAYLAARYGAERLGALATATSGRLPYVSAGAFRRVFGRSLAELWREYQATLVNDAPPHESPEGGVTRVTTHGFTVMGPRFAPPGCAECAPEIVYSVRTPHEFPSLNAVSLDGTAPRRLATRYLGSTTSAAGSLIVFDQQELRRNTGVYSDLFVLDRSSGRVTALTREARLTGPDISRDGRLVAVREGQGQRELVLVNVNTDDVSSIAGGDAAYEGVEVLVSEPGTQFDAPRWSPDGRSIAVERRRQGSLSEIVLVDAATRTVRPVTAVAGRAVTPAWRPDGGAIVAAAEVGGAVFELYEFPLDGSAPRQLTRTAGATWPDVSPDGKTIVFVGYTVDGFDLFTTPYPPITAAATPDALPSPAKASSGGVQPVRPAPAELQSPGKGAPATGARQYSPWSTLRPTSWSPVIENASDQLRVGLATGGYDVLAYHGYAVAASWLVNAPPGATRPGATVPDWEVAYAYDRWRPTFFISASSATSFFAGPAIGGVPSNATLRERQIEAGVLLPLRHVRSTHRAVATVLRSADAYTLADETTTAGRMAVRAGVASSTAKSYGYSISPEAGVAAGATGEWTRRIHGVSGSASTWTADARAYVPALRRHHVIAVRAAGGVSRGGTDISRTFRLGGSAANVDVLDFDRSALSLLRGFPSNAFAGRHVAVINADYRWPIARPQRGLRTWPIFVHTIHAAAFGDAGHAWSGGFRAGDIKTAVGGEVSANVVVAYGLPLTITAGAGWGRDGAERSNDGAAAYVRIGRAF